MEMDLLRVRSNGRMASVESAHRWRQRSAGNHRRWICSAGTGGPIYLLLEVEISAAGNLPRACQGRSGGLHPAALTASNLGELGGTREGIVFAEDIPSGKPTLSLYDSAKREVHDLVSLRSA